VPVGLSVADMLAGHVLVEGILAALVRRGISGDGAHVATSLLEVLVDFQFEVLTTFLNDGGRPPVRAAVDNAHAYLAAPYGVYDTADSYIALAMTPLERLEPVLGVSLAARDKDGFVERDRLKAIIAARLVEKPTAHWLDVLRAKDIWCAPVLDWKGLLASAAFQRLDLLQRVERDGADLTTTRAPLRIDGERPADRCGAPRVGEHDDQIRQEFGAE
jgi:crotonobetainyl-CoA:carnitine CoA-transferase CaiB-like acyl-CoA transferase